ncbi:SLAP domain-containing protein [Desulfolucanica intricata]|uniref:SLAP domain-containing protein n=1 Tax=Desulfolucanica intricata TaxID=1285191 RepID=UPI0008295E25|nr:SLAP domain-containing protein [Desulfolucanica intricata]
MLKFLKGLFVTNRQPTETDTISEEDLTGKEKNVEIALSVHPDFADRVSDKQKEFMIKELAQLSPIKEGEIAINGVYIVPSGDKVEVGIYIRNGLNRTIRLGGMYLILINKEKKELARQFFQLSNLGDIPPHTARPGEIFFDRENVFVDNIPRDDWKIIFNKIKAEKTVNIEFENLPDWIPDKEREDLEILLRELPAIKPGTLDISPYSAELIEDGRLVATVIFRNASEKTVKFNKLTLALLDARKRKVATALFNIDDLLIRPNKARLWTFAYPADTVIVEKPDLSKWSVEIIDK